MGRCRRSRLSYDGGCLLTCLLIGLLSLFNILLNVFCTWMLVVFLVLFSSEKGKCSSYQYRGYSIPHPTQRYIPYPIHSTLMGKASKNKIHGVEEWDPLLKTKSQKYDFFGYLHLQHHSATSVSDLLLAQPLGALIVRWFRDPVYPSISSSHTFRFECFKLI